MRNELAGGQGGLRCTPVPDAAGDLPTIDELLVEMDTEVARCRDTGDRRGYFAAMYRAVTRRIRDGLRNGEFEDAELLEQLDVVFARRWLDACHGWRAGDEITAPWQVAFEAADDAGLIIVQHLLLGINAHINLDLGIAAAETVDRRPELTIDDLSVDFVTINRVLADLVDRMQDAIGTVSPWMRCVDWVSARLDEGVAGFAIEVARDEAWSFATALSARRPDDREPLERERSAFTAALGRHVADPPWQIRVAVRVARLRERHDLDAVIDALDVDVSRDAR